MPESNQSSATVIETRL